MNFENICDLNRGVLNLEGNPQKFYMAVVLTNRVCTWKASKMSISEWMLGSFEKLQIHTFQMFK